MKSREQSRWTSTLTAAGMMTSIMAVSGLIPSAVALPQTRAQAGPKSPSTTTASETKLKSARGLEVSGTLVGTSVTLVARLQDSSHSVTAVRFLLDGKTLAEVGPPGQYVWNTRGLRFGRHVVQAQAFSGKSFVGISPPVALIVTGTASSTVVPLSFPAQRFHAHRVSNVMAPQLKINPAGSTLVPSDSVDALHNGDLAQPAHGLDLFDNQDPIVEVYLQPVKPELVPSSQAASTEQLTAVVPQQIAVQPTIQSASNTLGISSSPVADALPEPQRADSMNQSRATGSAEHIAWMPAPVSLNPLAIHESGEDKSKDLMADLNVASGSQGIDLSPRLVGSATPAGTNGLRMASEGTVRRTENPISVVMTESGQVAVLVATVQTLNGAFEVQRTGATEVQPLQERAPLYGGDVTNTGSNSKATLLFNEGSRLDVNTGTIVEFTTPASVNGNRQSYFRLIKGEAFLRARSALAVQTRSATAAVRGTTFDLIVDDQGNSVLTVHEGSADFFNAQGAVVVHASQRSIARPGLAPTTPMPAPNHVNDISWTLALDQALATGGGVNGVVKPRHRKRSLWNRKWVKILVPTLVIAVIPVITNGNDDNNRGRGGTDQSPGF